MIYSRDHIGSQTTLIGGEGGGKVTKWDTEGKINVALMMRNVSTVLSKIVAWDRERTGRAIWWFPGSSPSSCHSLDLFSVFPSATPWLRSVNNQLVCLYHLGFLTMLYSFEIFVSLHNSTSYYL